jgi:hypothetical protein
METKLNDPYTTDSTQKEEKKTSGTQKEKKISKKLLGCVERSTTTCYMICLIMR